MRIRAARTLVFLRENGQLLGFNYLSKKSFACSQDLLAFLPMVDEWTEVADICAKLGAQERVFDAQVEALIDVSAIVAEGSLVAHDEARFVADWNWGLPAALFHQSVRDRPCMTVEEGEAVQRERLVSGQPAPALFSRMLPPAEQIMLPRAPSPVLEVMAQRRTIRSASAPTVALEDVADCLFAGLGIVGHTRNGVGVSLPLSMTPSGGARNPYEAFVCARRVDGLAAGVYHYSAVDHALEPIDGADLPLLSELIGGQEWADDMPVMIILVAYFDRSAWKYHDANAYRVVLIEAGHIGQNIMLAATERGLSACPSAALDHSKISDLLGLDGLMHGAPIYALTVAHPGHAEAMIPVAAPSDRTQRGIADASTEGLEIRA